MKKVKVTRRVARKVPWYERPPLLFGSIALVLLVSGIVMAHLHGGPSTSGEPSSGALEDSLAAGADSLVDVADELPMHVLGSDAPLPPTEPGQCLPPMQVETLMDAAAIRTKLRDARMLQPLVTPDGSAGPTEGTPVFAYAPVKSLLEAAADGSEPEVIWSRLALTMEDQPRKDFEFHRDRSGYVYVEAFVSSEVAEALGVLGPNLVLDTPPEVDRPPKWQFWKKQTEPEKLVLYRGSEITLHPDLSPEATCVVVLPLQRIRPLRVREIRIAMARPVEVLDVALQ